MSRPLKIAWYSYFPVEWLPNLPCELRDLPRQHPATWQRALLDEFQKDPDLSIDIIVLRKNFRENFVFQTGNARFHCIKTFGGMRSATLYWLDTLLVRRKLKELKPDITHAWGTEFGAAAIAGRLNFPVLVTMQGILTWYGSIFPLNRHQKIARFLEPPSLRKATHVSAESSFAMSYLGDRYPHLRLFQIEHAPARLFAKVQRQPPATTTRLLCAGSFLSWKGADVVIEALNGLLNTHQFELLWLGSKDNTLEQQLRQRTNPDLWKRIRFEHTDSAGVAQAQATTTIFVHAALADNSPNSVKEAVVAGVPVVATETGGIPDYVLPGQNGYLFRSGDVQDCREKLQMAFAHPLFSKGEVDGATLQEMRQYLSAETMASKFKAAYLETIAASR